MSCRTRAKGFERRTSFVRGTDTESAIHLKSVDHDPWTVVEPETRNKMDVPASLTLVPQLLALAQESLARGKPWPMAFPGTTNRSTHEFPSQGGGWWPCFGTTDPAWWRCRIGDRVKSNTNVIELIPMKPYLRRIAKAHVLKVTVTLSFTEKYLTGLYSLLCDESFRFPSAVIHQPDIHHAFPAIPVLAGTLRCLE